MMCNNTLALQITSLTISVSTFTMCFLVEFMFILKEIKYHFKRSNGKQNLTRLVVSYEIYETSLFELIYEMSLWRAS